MWVPDGKRILDKDLMDTGMVKIIYYQILFQIFFQGFKQLLTSIDPYLGF